MPSHFQERPDKFDMIGDILILLQIPENEQDEMRKQLMKMNAKHLGNLCYYVEELIKK